MRLHTLGSDTTNEYLALHELLGSLQVVVSICIQSGCRQVKQSLWWSKDGHLCLAQQQPPREREGREKRDSRSPPSPEESPVAFVDRYLEKHISPLKSNVKMNPLFMAIRSMGDGDNVKSQPSWTVKEYDTQTMHSNLADYLKKTPKELDFWLEDLYTPGFDSLLRKKEAEQKRKSLCKLSVSTLSGVFMVHL
uniref:Major intrinsically disordered Notch2-binding receptor 1-like C-terminal domain-containing protein n=1 Tax=Mola mola TaxID=94237 RepID=A0A3Q3X9E2_MOLML